MEWPITGGDNRSARDEARILTAFLFFTESFSDWFEEKVHLPIFDEIQPVPVQATAPAASSGLAGTLLPLQTLQPLIMKRDEEVAFVLGHGHLTPPQSPPADESQLTAPIFIVQQQPSYVTLQPTQPEFVEESYLIAPPTPDLAHEMAVVDEVVRGAAQQWEQWESSDTNSRSSDGTEDSDDPEWIPAEAPTKPTGRRARQPRPYNPVDRRLRKKEQNKNAATRYRQKKKAEVNVIVEEERGLEEQNAALQTKLTDLQREVCYLKGLMRDVFRAKGLVK